MDGEDRLRTMWKSLKQRLGFTGLACCGSSWNLRVSDVTMRGGGGEGEEEEEQIQAQLFSEEEPMIVAPNQGSVNLATALAAERRFRSVELKTLMRLFEETDGREEKRSLKWYIKEEGGGDGMEEMCCVCMERNKGAAFIPCGHTYCRVCSRELWLNRGFCPLCNRSITEVLNIF
ncbi:unnamed protein product [Withania somnifera]